MRAEAAKILNPKADGAPRQVVLLGATGSIGQSTLSVLDDNPEAYRLFAVSAHRNIDKLAEIIDRYRPKYAVVSCDDCEQEAVELNNVLRQKRASTEVLYGSQHLEAVVSVDEVDVVVAAIVGAAGLASVMAAASSGKQLLLANKEAIVMGGSVFMRAVREGAATILPIDSEHNAIFQCLPPQLTDSLSGRVLQADLTKLNIAEVGVSKILLTGSGGPLRCTPVSELKGVTPEQACAHPNWSMGPKISVDSATMMNKGLELIEACWLFACSESDIDIVIHPQSIVHSMVQYKDGSVLAHMGQPDMRTPIAHALAWPRRISNQVESLDWQKMSDLTFESPDLERFPSLRLARQVAAAKDSSAIVMNAANEVLVQAFLDRKIRFDHICDGVAECLDSIASRDKLGSIDEIVAIDHETRRIAEGLIDKLLKYKAE